MTEPDHTVVLIVKRYIADQVVGVRAYVHSKVLDTDKKTPRLLRCESV